MRRRFNGGEHVALYLAAGGRCEGCGEELERGWHADHKQPWSAGGETDIANGAALCPRCNLEKGTNLTGSPGNGGVFDPRRFQVELAERTLERVRAGEEATVADCAPGCGKTAAAYLTATTLLREKLIDRVIYLTPRTNLCDQVADEWNSLAGMRFAEKWDAGARFRVTRWLPNATPLIPADVECFVTTYSSALAQPDLFKNAAAGVAGRFLLVCDEAQYLGDRGEQPDGSRGTQSAAVVKAMIPHARHVLMMTGTPNRSDGVAIPSVVYDDPDETGFRRMEWHVRSTYTQGVAESYLRRFHFALTDGEIDYRWWNTMEVDNLSISQWEHGMRDPLLNPGTWRPLVDQAVERLRAIQQLDRRYKALVPCVTQDHAQAVRRYLHDRGVATTIAVSKDLGDARKRLHAFKTSRDDVLVTVQMAYVGYNHTPISVVCCLSNIRFEGYLRQMIARGLRIWNERPIDEQVCYLIAPRDPKMVEFARQMERESAAGVKVRKEKPPPPPPPGPAGFVEDVRLDGAYHVIGSHGEIAAAEAARIRDALREAHLEHVGEDKLKAVLNHLSQPQQPHVSEGVTREWREVEKTYKKQERQMCGRMLRVQGFNHVNDSDAYKAAIARLTARINERQGVTSRREVQTEEAWMKRFAVIRQLEKELTVGV